MLHDYMILYNVAWFSNFNVYKAWESSFYLFQRYSTLWPVTNGIVIEWLYEANVEFVNFIYRSITILSTYMYRNSYILTLQDIYTNKYNRTLTMSTANQLSTT